MKISDLSALLSKVTQTAGDVDVVLKDDSTEVETVITDLAIHIDPASGGVGGTLEIMHGAAPPAPAVAADVPADPGIAAP